MRDFFGNIVRKNPLTGEKIPPKEIKRDILDENKRRGRAGEGEARFRAEMNGYEMKRTGIGHDYKATRVDLFSGKKEVKYVEVKTGKAKLSKRQEGEKKNYVVTREDLWFY